MSLFKPFWMQSFPYGSDEKKKKCLAKLDSITDESLLIQIAKETPVKEYRRYAEKRIKDQDVLKELALRYYDDEAVARVKDQEVLKSIALTAASQQTVSVAVSHIDDDDFFINGFIDKVLNDELPCLKDRGPYRTGLVSKVLGQINDQEYLYHVASLNEFGIPFFIDEQKAAVMNITDRKKLFMLAKNAKHDVAAVAISKMTDKEDLNWLVKHCNAKGMTPNIAQMAAMRLRNERFC